MKAKWSLNINQSHKISYILDQFQWQQKQNQTLTNTRQDGSLKRRLWIKLQNEKEEDFFFKKAYTPHKTKRGRLLHKKVNFFLRTKTVGARRQISRRTGSNSGLFYQDFINSASQHLRKNAISTKIRVKVHPFINPNPKAYKIRRRKNKERNQNIYRFTQADSSGHQDHPELHKLPAIKQPIDQEMASTA